MNGSRKTAEPEQVPIILSRSVLNNNLIKKRLQPKKKKQVGNCSPEEVLSSTLQPTPSTVLAKRLFYVQSGVSKRLVRVKFQR